MKNFHVTNRYAMINFDANDIKGQADILCSVAFEKTLNGFLKDLKQKDDEILTLLGFLTIDEIINLYKLLLVNDVKTAFKQAKNINYDLRLPLYDFTEKFYDYWRNLARFGLVKGSRAYNQTNRINDLISTADFFNDKVITLYRSISQRLLKSDFNILRQLAAGVNANMLYVRHKFTSNDNYESIQNIPFITKVVINPPFIINSKSNTRKFLFDEIDYNPLSNYQINKDHFLVFPIKVGPLLAFVYVHRDFTHQGIALTNLFEFANYQEFKNKKPDIVVMYGLRETTEDYKYYYDEEEKLHIGFVSHNDENDYFGYLKKMLLTLHNVIMIRNGNLPIHGAMAKIKLKNNKTKNVVIIGDSGAGKSETLEALRVIGDKYIKKIDIVFDDMGTFKLSGDKVVANGTETGAFVRLDDLDAGYAYEIMDRALFLNPSQKNSRVVIPISSYKLITTNHQIDMLLYANNYDKEKSGLKQLNNLTEALSIFKRGKRKAKGTTQEIGLVETYFANPFGPLQMRTETDLLLDKYFNALYEQNVFMGEIYTKLAVSGEESNGPKEAATLLLEYLIK